MAKFVIVIEDAEDGTVDISCNVENSDGFIKINPNKQYAHGVTCMVLDYLDIPYDQTVAEIH